MSRPEWLPGFVVEDGKVLRSHRPLPDAATAKRNLERNEANRPHWLKATEEKKSAFTPFPSLTEGPIYKEMKSELIPDSVKHERVKRITARLVRKGYSPDPIVLAGLVEAHRFVKDDDLVRLYRKAIDERARGKELPKGSLSREPQLRVTDDMRQGWGDYEFPFEVSETPYPPGSRRAARFPLAAYRELATRATAAQAAKALGRSLTELLRDIGSGAITLKKGIAKMELNELSKGQLVAVHNFLASKSAAEEKPTEVKGFKSNTVGQERVATLLSAYADAGNVADIEAVLKLAEKRAKRQAKKNGEDTGAVTEKKVKEPKERKAATTVGRDEDGYRIGSTRQKAWLFLKENGFEVEIKDLIEHLYGSFEEGKSAINGVLRGFEADAERTGRTPEKKKVDGVTYLALVQAS